MVGIFNRMGEKLSSEKCPNCGADVVVKFTYSESERRPFFANADGSRHICNSESKPFDKHPIGQAVKGKVIADFQLRGRCLTITLEDGNVLSVSAAGKPLSIALEGPAGIIQE